MGISWEAFAPPLDPPSDGGLPVVYALEIVGQYWLSDPYLALAMLWEAYAASLPPEPAVVSVSTGAQSIGYGSAGGASAFALAMARAEHFRSMRGGLASVPLRVGQAEPPDLPIDFWQRNLCD